MPLANVSLVVRLGVGCPCFHSYVFGVVQASSSPLLTAAYNTKARLDAGLIGDDEMTGVVPSLPVTAVTDTFAACQWCADSFRDAAACAAHEATCPYQRYRPAECSQCHSMVPAERLDNEACSACAMGSAGTQTDGGVGVGVGVSA